MGLFGKSDEERTNQHQQQKRQINQLNNRIDSLQQNIDKLNSRIGQIEDSLRELDQTEDYEVDQLEDDLASTERSLRSSISAVRQQVQDVQSTVEEEYKPQLTAEQNLLEDITDSLRFLRQRLSTYGKIRQKVDALTETVNGIDAELNGKVGRTTFEEFQREMREKIQRLESQLDRIE